MTLADLVLTTEQQAIVDHPLEPLRIAAGAGTGKTTTVVARLVSLIRHRGLSPETALGMTFTNKAAAELADRIRAELPELAEAGREIEVTTYHGFGLRLLSEFGALIGVERDIAVVGPGYVRQLLIESVGTDPYTRLDMTKAKHRLDDAANLRSQMVENLVAVERLAGLSPGLDDDPQHDRIELVRILDNYAARKRELGVVDYGDLIAEAHRLVTEFPEIATRIRSRYSAVLLDEYQDTDPAQRELLRTIFSSGFPITAVGDADQTIYEWRGASLENFAGFPDHFPTVDGHRPATLPLTLNRRSDRLILDVANRIRRDIESDEAAAPGPLRPADAAEQGEVGVGWFRTEDDEAAWIAQEIARLAGEEGAEWRSVAILFRKNASIPIVGDALRIAGIPFEVASLGGLLAVPEVADVHAWLSILGRPEDTASLVRILLGGRYRLGLGDLVPLASWARSQQRGRDTDDDVAFPMLESIEHLERIEGLRGEARTRLEGFRASYRHLLQLAQSITLSELVRRIVDEIHGWAEIEAMEPTAGLTARLNLYRLIDLTETWSPLSGRPSLDAFLDYLELLEDEPTAQELDTARIGSGNAVSLLTVHRSKGLEWDAVFLPALARRVFPSDSHGFDLPESRARWLPYSLRLDQATFGAAPDDTKGRRDWQRERHLRQEHRTAYVATTRARNRLYLTGAMWAGRTERPREPSQYLELAAATPGVRTITWATDPGERPSIRVSPDAGPDPVFEGGWQAAVMSTIDDPSWPERAASDRAVFQEQRHQLELMLDGLPQPQLVAEPAPLTTSVTGLTTLAACPKRFFWSEIDPLPRRPSPALRRGTQVHRTIELHHRGIAAFEDLDVGVADLAEERPDGAVDPVANFMGSRFATETPILIEAPIDIDVGEIRVRGRVDAVFEPEPGTWEIVDYKSGRPSEHDAARVQLDAYAVAAAEGALGHAAPDHIVTTFAYLGVDPIHERSTAMTPDEVAAARDRLEHLAGQATGDAFSATPSAACASCPFSDVCEPGQVWLAAHAS